MPPTYPPLSLPAVLFAHRGARAHAPENTLEAFRLALRLGATGIRSTAWCSADGAVVLDASGSVGGRFRRRPIGGTAAADLPEELVTLADLYGEIGAEFELYLEVPDPAALDPVLSAASANGALARLWLSHPDLEELASWRNRCGAARLVHSTRIPSMERGPEHHGARLRELAVDAVDLHHMEWSAGSVALYHRFGRYCIGSDAQQERVILSLLAMGIDGVVSDHVDRLVDSTALA